MVISVQANHIHPFNQSDRSRNVTHVAQPSFIRIRTNIHTKYLLLIFGSACGYFSFWYGSRVHLQEWSLENYISQSNSLLQQGNTINKCPGLQQHNQELQKKKITIPQNITYRYIQGTHTIRFCCSISVENTLPDHVVPATGQNNGNGNSFTGFLDSININDELNSYFLSHSLRKGTSFK